MTTIVTRAGKGSPLTHTEVDTNFTNLNTAKLETAAIPLGTAAAPSVSFLSDPNTGIYSPEADTLAFVTAGSNRVHITSGGLVGIGSSSPQAKLHIVLTSSATTPIVNVGSFGTAGSVTLGGIASNSEHVYLGTGDSAGGGIAAGIGFMREAGGWNSALSFYTNNVTSGPNGVSAIQEKMRITSGGLVGIGVTSPGVSLEVAGPTGDNIIATFRSGDATAANNTGGGFRSISSATATSRIAQVWLDADGANFSGGDYFFIQKNGNSGTVDFNQFSNAAMTFKTNDTERARIDSSGRLLVGTSNSPSTGQGNASNFVIQGFTGNPTSLGLASIQRGETAANITADEVIGRISFNDSDGNSFGWIEMDADANAGAVSDFPGRLKFSTTADGAASPTERMRITKEGSSRFFCSAGVDTIDAASAEAAGTSRYLFLGEHSATGTGTGTNCYRVYTNGNVQNTNGSYTTISDAKLKENIVNAGSQWDDLKAIQIRNWNFKVETGHETHRQIGPIAQELETVCPGLVFETPDRDEDGNETGGVTKGVNQSVLYMKAVKALQEAMERIEQLETSNIDLLARVIALEAN